jgi:hypothetical protein
MFVDNMPCRFLVHLYGASLSQVLAVETIVSIFDRYEVMVQRMVRIVRVRM